MAKTKTIVVKYKTSEISEVLSFYFSDLVFSTAELLPAISHARSESL
jgi:hypothetical protein